MYFGGVDEMISFTVVLFLKWSTGDGSMHQCWDKVSDDGCVFG